MLKFALTIYYGDTMAGVTAVLAAASIAFGGGSHEIGPGDAGAFRSPELGPKIGLMATPLLSEVTVFNPEEYARQLASEEQTVAAIPKEKVDYTADDVVDCTDHIGDRYTVTPQDCPDPALLREVSTINQTIAGVKKDIKAAAKDCMSVDYTIGMFVLGMKVAFNKTHSRLARPKTLKERVLTIDNGYRLAGSVVVGYGLLLMGAVATSPRRMARFGQKPA